MYFWTFRARTLSRKSTFRGRLVEFQHVGTISLGNMKIVPLRWIYFPRMNQGWVSIKEYWIHFEINIDYFDCAHFLAVLCESGVFPRSRVFPKHCDFPFPYRPRLQWRFHVLRAVFLPDLPPCRLHRHPFRIHLDISIFGRAPNVCTLRRFVLRIKGFSS